MDDICKDKTKCEYNESWPDCKESCPNMTDKDYKQKIEDELRQKECEGCELEKFYFLDLLNCWKCRTEKYQNKLIQAYQDIEHKNKLILKQVEENARLTKQIQDSSKIFK